jgi:hypothetical protein
MDKKEFLLGNPSEKKHSVRYYALDKNAPMESVYVTKEAFGSQQYPAKIKITIEEA